MVFLGLSLGSCLGKSQGLSIDSDINLRLRCTSLLGTRVGAALHSEDLSQHLLDLGSHVEYHVDLLLGAALVLFNLVGKFLNLLSNGFVIL